MVQELSIISSGPSRYVPESVATWSTQAILFDNYLTYVEGTKKLIFLHQIKSVICCNLSNPGWKLLTTEVNNVELE